VDDFSTSFFGEIDRDAILPNIQILKERGVVWSRFAVQKRLQSARRVDAALRVDAHQCSAVIGKNASARWTCHHPHEVENFYIGKGETIRHVFALFQVQIPSAVKKG
jgi:hypothetical protein